jgi:DNA-directed RNA polymerase specialized sigma24 family protein
VLTQLLGYSTSEAAETLAVKPATIRKLNEQARGRLRRRMSSGTEEHVDG